MEQLELFATGELQPIRKWLHVWDVERRKKARAEAQANGRCEPTGDEVIAERKRGKR